ncbi:sporulation integral membrane protein YlbJ [Thermohalobacter berrensis]|uniref:Sporulation integral membrane protein YlbJ n=2 Tax=Thermohalobacter berrensis TaxID=99594 RepID=A0A419TBA1_9FIRM|nr:sporulation integral membrane protein YlbJ [Thermohalobacter berrensis]
MLIVLTIVLFPENSVKAAYRGVNTWFNIVLPSLLPFFICSEILIGLGVVNFIGTLLQPIMNPFFNVPGEGAFPFAMSITSGYPVGVKLAAKLRTQNILTKAEAQRLVSFSSTSGPLFMIGAVAVGMFNNATLGALIAIAHYLGAITVGLIFRFYGDKRKIPKKSEKSYIKKAFRELIKAKENDGRSFGMLMGDAVKESFNTMLMIGGFIILYSVIIEILTLTRLEELISYLITSLVPILEDKELIRATLSGIIEITNGCNMLSNVTNSSYLSKISIVSFLIGWSGFSIISQAASIISKTDIKLSIYTLSKFLHGIFASIYTILLYILFFKDKVKPASIVLQQGKVNFVSSDWISIFSFSTKIYFIILLCLILIGITLSLLNQKIVTR